MAKSEIYREVWDMETKEGVSRKVTKQLLEEVDGRDYGYVRHVLLCALKYMSEDEVADMVRCNELLDNEEV